MVKDNAGDIAFYGKPISELRSVTCHTLPDDTGKCARLNPSQIGRYSIYLPRRDGRLSWPRRLVTYRGSHPSKY